MRNFSNTSICVSTLILIGFLFSSAFCAVPGGDVGVFLELPPSVSSAAFGGACYTFNPEPDAIFINPANLYNSQAISGGASFENYPLSVQRYSLAGVIPWRNFRIGAGMVQHSIGKITGRDDVGNITSTFGYRYIAYSLGGAYGVSRGKMQDACRSPFWEFSAGLSTKFLTQYEADSIAGAGYTLGIGISGKYQFIRYGLSIDNVFSQMVWKDAASTKNSLPTAVVAGIGFEYCQSSWFELSVENKVSDRFRFRAGGQYLFNDWAAFRAGLDFQTGSPTPSNEWKLSLGGAFYRKFLIPMEISYSVQYIAAIDNFSFGIGLNWNTF